MATTKRPEWLAPALDYAERWLAFQMRQTETPGLVFAAVDAGGILAERAFGFADLAAGAPLTPDHRFRVASHSKTFTAAGVMLLHEAGRLHLDDPVGRHVEGLHADVGAATLSQLLCHSGGIVRDGTDAGHWVDRRPFPDAAELRAMLAVAPTLDPNSRFKYSNVGYGLLGLAIEAITGEPYGAWMTRSVIEPARLDATTPDRPDPAAVPMATGHGGKALLGRRFPIPGRNATRALAPAAGFTSTAGDLARFMLSLDPAAASSLLTAASRREMTRRQWRIPDLDGERHYGLGIMGGAVKGRTWFGHSGGLQGFITRTLCVPEWGLALSALTNGFDGPAQSWTDGVIGILHRFAAGGAPKPELSGWSGRWCNLWYAADLVPVGSRVLVANPALAAPFAEASEIEVLREDAGRIVQASGMASHGEPARLVRGPDGMVERIWIGGSELLTEAAARAEIEGRIAAP